MKSAPILAVVVLASGLAVGLPARVEQKTVRGFVLDIPSSTVFQLDEHIVVHAGILRGDPTPGSWGALAGSVLIDTCGVSCLVAGATRLGEKTFPR